jgi:hypothetical protein
MTIAVIGAIALGAAIFVDVWLCYIVAAAAYALSFAVSHYVFGRLARQHALLDDKQL